MLGGACPGKEPPLSPNIRRVALVALAAFVHLLGLSAPTAIAKRAVYADYAGTPSYVKPFPVASNGSLSPGAAIMAGTSPRAIAITPDGSRLFVANSGSTVISAFGVEPATGELTARPAVSAPSGPVALAITPDGTTMFSANPSGSVSAFVIDALGNASPAPLGGADLAGTGPDGLAVSPDGLRLFVSEGSANKLAVFTIGSNGTLTSASTVDTGAGPAGVTVSADGSRVYVANSGDDNVSGFSASAGGSLATLAGTPYAAGDGASGIAISPDGMRLLVANPTAGTLTPFLVDTTTGALTAQLATSGLPGISGVAISPDGKSAYVADSSKARAFSFGADAALSPVGLNFDVPAQAGGIAISPNLAPFATFEPVPGSAGSATLFLGTLAHDSDGSVSRWHWTFGDGVSSDEQSPAHTYAQAGSYTVTLTVVDNEGCSTARVFTGQTASCAGGPSASQSHTIEVPPAPDTTPIPPPCQHVGNDGFCGTPDQTAPTVTVLGFNDGASITTVDAPETIVGTIANDPSGIQSVRLRFMKGAGFLIKKKKVRKRVCHKVKGRKKKKCVRKTVTRKIKTSTPLCLAPSGTKNYLVTYVCSKVPWIALTGSGQFRWDIPVVLGVGTYTVEVIATDGAGNADALEVGRNRMTFKVVKTPSNVDGGTSTSTTPTTTAPPVDDTGSPFGKG